MLIIAICTWFILQSYLVGKVLASVLVIYKANRSNTVVTSCFYMVKNYG